MTTPTYIRPTNAETGQPTLAVHFTAELCKLADAHQYDLEARTQDLATDVRDHLHQVGLAIRPTLLPGRARIVQEVNEGEEVASEPVFLSTVIAFLTDAEPGDARLDALASGFYSGRVDTHVEFEIPTIESEAELEQAIAADRARGAAFVATSSAPAAPAVVAVAGDDDEDPEAWLS